jgi:hypothetical protein
MPKGILQFTERGLRRAIRATLKEGLVVRGHETTKDGTIRVFTVPPGMSEVGASNPWDEVLDDAADKKRTS